MKNCFLRLLSSITFCAALAACSATSTDPSDTYKGETQQQIYAAGKKSLQSRNYAESIRRFEALDVQYPYGRETEDAQLYLIYAYYMKEEFALSFAAADHYIRLHPASPHVDYAYYMRGVADFYQSQGFVERFLAIDLAKRDLTQMKKAFNDFNEVVIKFPNSRYAPAAHEYMILLRNLLADNELHVANYYYVRGAYIAAANRASGLIANYQGAPTVVDALVLLAKCYHQLGMKEQEQNTLLVLKYNYPDVKVVL